MKALITGSSGRIGRAIFNALAPQHSVVGLDRSPFSSSQFIGDFTDSTLLRRALEGIDTVFHTAAYHAPHVGLIPEAEFERVNVAGVHQLLEEACKAGVRNFIFTSTTALYGSAIQHGACTWVDESLVPQPKTVYHRTKLAAEQLIAHWPGSLTRSVIRMSRCFPQPADQMSVLRLHRGLDARDVADAHIAAVHAPAGTFNRFVVSGSTPFLREDVEELARDAAQVLQRRCPELVAEHALRGWPLPTVIDRVYDGSAITEALGWKPAYGFKEVLAQADRRSLEVLPYMPDFVDRTAE
ncbi:NAD-dependent epimerase/dehydratase family protein [Stenotrophomonas bentonitica]|uniref:NAD-dependent epimerase/dehydratase family protein n=1 Tax=Stenotrophomonas bentonitica TaxID=1450134 RepID=UPI00345E127B